MTTRRQLGLARVPARETNGGPASRGGTMKQRFPFSPNPVGWFVVAYSDELPVRGVLPLSYFGTELVLFRDETGAAHVLDAHCPHLGAHLGHGGVVAGGSIRCPFHS